MTWKAYYCQDGNAAQSDLQIPGKPVKIPMTFSGKREKKHPEIHREFQGVPNSQNNPAKEEYHWQSHTSHFKTYYEALIIKTVWYQLKDRHRDLRNRMASPLINLHVHGQIIFNKGAKTIRRRKDNIINKRCSENWIPHAKKKAGPLLCPTQKTNSKLTRRKHQELNYKRKHSGEFS